MGILYSCCCGGEREGIAAEPLLRDPEVYTPSNVPIEQYNNPGNIVSSHLGSNERPEINGSFRQIGNYWQQNHNKCLSQYYLLDTMYDSAIHQQITNSIITFQISLKEWGDKDL